MAISIKKVGNKVTIVADLDGTELSASGKSTVLATSSGFIAVPEAPEIKVSLNIIKARR